MGCDCHIDGCLGEVLGKFHFLNAFSTLLKSEPWNMKIFNQNLSLREKTSKTILREIATGCKYNRLIKIG